MAKLPDSADDVRIGSLDGSQVAEQSQTEHPHADVEEQTNRDYYGCKNVHPSALERPCMCFLG